MAVDLRNNSLLSRSSLVFTEDALVKLEHRYTHDRLRKFMYDAIESVVIWRRNAWLQIILVTICLMLPGIALLFADSDPSTIIAIFLIAVASILLVWYVYCGKSTLRIVRAGQATDLTGIYRPGQLRRFRDQFIENIHRVQQARIAAEMQAQAVEMPAQEAEMLQQADGAGEGAVQEQESAQIPFAQVAEQSPASGEQPAAQ